MERTFFAESPVLDMGICYAREKLGRILCRESGAASIAVPSRAQPAETDGNGISDLTRRAAVVSFT